jgi:hypothetical protein
MTNEMDCNNCVVTDLEDQECDACHQEQVVKKEKPDPSALNNLLVCVASMEIGMICVDDDGYYLTYGKFYEVVSESNGWGRVVNDVGRVDDYPCSAFSQAN